MSKHILVIVTSHNQINANHATGLWFEEFAQPYELFQRQGYQVTVASPKGGQTPIDPRSLPDEAERVKYNDALSVLENTTPLVSVDAKQFDAVFLPGGHGTMFDLPSALVGNLIGEFAEAGKIVAAVCHGPAGLVGAKHMDGTPVVQGYRLTSFTNEEEVAANLASEMPFLLQDKLSELGAQFVASPMWNDHVEVDRNLVTGQNPQSSHSTAQAVIDLLEKVGARV